MKFQFALAFGLIAFLAVVQARDISIFLNNERLVKWQINCLLNQGSCDIIGKLLKGMLPKALENNCGRCDSIQKELSEDLIKFMKLKHPKEWRAIEKLYTVSKKEIVPNTKDVVKTSVQDLQPHS